MICKLCLSDTELRESHIIPRFMHKPLFDESGRFIEISTDPTVRERITQKQLKQKLLCCDCEQKIGRWENYTRDLLFNKSSKPEVYDIARVFSGVEYKIFKLFQLSLLWRASVSTLEFFRDVRLSSSPHEEKIRMMLLNDNPGKYYEYGCIILFSEDKNLRRIMDILIEPNAFRYETFRGYKFCLNGLFWHFVTSRHTINFPFRAGFLQEDGNLPILSDFGYAKQEYAKLYQASIVRKNNQL
jgi:hypothetical protein